VTSGHRMVGQTSGAFLVIQAFRDRAMSHRGDNGRRFRVEHVKSRLTHREGRRAPSHTEFARFCGGSDVVRGGLSGDGG